MMSSVNSFVAAPEAGRLAMMIPTLGDTVVPLLAMMALTGFPFKGRKFVPFAIYV